MNNKSISCHECLVTNQHTPVRVENFATKKKNFWCLVVDTKALIGDLEADYDIHYINIIYCPFCGVKLNENI